LLACFACVEQPQRRYRHRFPITEIVRLEADNRVERFSARDISVSGIYLNGVAPVPVGTIVTLTFADFTVEANMARVTADGFALAFEATIRNRALIVRYIFSKHYAMNERKIRPMKVAIALASRVFR